MRMAGFGAGRGANQPHDETEAEFWARYEVDGPLTAEQDPDMNGGYVNPAEVKWIDRDPWQVYDDQWGRRNFNEPLHEDAELFGPIAPETETIFSSARQLMLLGGAFTTIGLFAVVVHAFTPEHTTSRRRFPGGLYEELGGKGTVYPPVDPKFIDTE